VVFIYPIESPYVSSVVLSVVSLVLFGLPIKAPCLAVVVLSSLSKHLGVLVLFCLLSRWFCRFSLSLLFSFIIPLEILYLCGTVLSTLTKHNVSQVLL